MTGNWEEQAEGRIVKIDNWGGLLSTVQSAPAKRSACAASACI